ncbi:hypothetical protein GCM10028789_31220 [Sinomonas halotolerans]
MPRRTTCPIYRPTDPDAEGGAPPLVPAGPATDRDGSGDSAPSTGDSGGDSGSGGGGGGD